MEITQHKLTMVEEKTSPNQDARPSGAEPSLIVIHCISLPAGHFGGPYIDQLFTNQINCQQHDDFNDLNDLRVSAHLVIRRNGAVTQFVPFNQRAWHAGESCYAGRQACNDFSIGIELEGVDTGYYTPSQYEQLATICRLLLRNYKTLSEDRITGHSDIAPQRKTDPGEGFDWAHFRALLSSS